MQEHAQGSAVFQAFALETEFLMTQGLRPRKA
jgi:hypothetical protein